MSKKKNQKFSGFTLLEMMLVLLVISVLILLFVPNLAERKKEVDEKGKDALEKVVETQSEMYKINEGDGVVTYTDLEAKGYLTEKQVDRAEKYGITVE